MSGGSFCYLCWQIQDLDESLEGLERAHENTSNMIECIEHHRLDAEFITALKDYDRDLNRVIQAFYDQLYIFKQKHKPSRAFINVLENVEWWQSSDRGRKDAEKAIEAWKDSEKN